MWWSGSGLEMALIPETESMFIIILLLVFILVIVLLLMVLHSYSSRLKDAETALRREVEGRRRLSASIKERTAEGERLRKRLLEAETRRVPPPPPPPPPQGFVSYGEVEAVRMYEKVTEKAPAYDLLSDERDKELAAFLGLEDEEEEQERKREKDLEGREEAAEAGGEEKRKAIRILDVFLIYKDGRLLFHLSKKQRLVDQSQQTGAMLTALQGFVKMSLDRDRGGALDELVSGKLCIVMEYGELANIAVVIEGRGTEELRAYMRNALKEIHKEHYAELLAWDGRDQTLGGEEAIIRRHIIGEYDTEEFHNANVEILDLSGAGTFTVKEEEGEKKGKGKGDKEDYPDDGWGM